MDVIITFAEVNYQKLPPAKLISTYQIRGTKLHFMLARLLGFTHLVIEGDSLVIEEDSLVIEGGYYYPRNACLLFV